MIYTTCGEMKIYLFKYFVLWLFCLFSPNKCQRVCVCASMSVSLAFFSRVCVCVLIFRIHWTEPNSNGQKIYIDRTNSFCIHLISQCHLSTWNRSHSFFFIFFLSLSLASIRFMLAHTYSIIISVRFFKCNHAICSFHSFRSFSQFYAIKCI